MNQKQDLYGKTIVITGATAGIGLAAAKALAGRGAHVIGVGRSDERCRSARQTIQDEFPVASVSMLVADLSSQRQVRQLAADIRALVQEASDARLDVLVNNAGTVSSWHKVTEDGCELQFAVNHLAPFLLTHELLPLLRQAPAARVVTVSSGSHYGTDMHWSDVMYRQRYNCLAAYKQSKLANVLFTAELNRRLGDQSSVRAYALDPGLVNTEIGLKGTSGIENLVWQLRRSGGVTPEQGADTVVYLASEPHIAALHRIYWKERTPLAPSSTALCDEEAARLWALSERLCGVVWLPEEVFA